MKNINNNLIEKLSAEGNTSNKLKDNETNYNNFIKDIFKELENNTFNCNEFYNSFDKLSKKYFNNDEIEENLNKIIKNKLNREITDYLYNIKKEVMIIVRKNTEVLDDSNKIKLDESNISSTLYNNSTDFIDKFCKRLLDQLSLKEAIESIISNSGNEIDLLKNEIKEMQTSLKNINREHTTILGIFTAIVMTFVGSIAFSTKVLEAIGSVNIFKLFLVIEFIGFILFNIINKLMEIITKDYQKHLNDVNNVNKYIGVAFTLTLIIWLCILTYICYGKGIDYVLFMLLNNEL